MSRKAIYSLSIFIIACLIFIPFLGRVHLFDWDEINFAESAREMLVSHNYSIVQINFKPFWEKPPLFIWLQALSMSLFGINEFAARFPNALCGAFTLLVLFRIGMKHFDFKFGLLWVLVYTTSFLPFFYFKSGIIDPWFNLFIFLGIYQLLEYMKKKTYKALLLSACAIGLAVLTKGPVGLLICILTFLIYCVLARFKRFPPVKDILLYALVVATVGGTWFLYLFIRGEGHIVAEFINYQIRLLQTGDAGHGGPFYYHFVVLLFGCFPMSLIALPQFFEKAAFKDRYLMRWMKVLFFTVLILFSIVKTKIIHYSSLCYFPLSFIATYYLYQVLYRSKLIKKIIPWLIGIFGFLFALAFALIPQINNLRPWLLRNHILKDPFAKLALEANVHWYLYDEIPALLLLGGILLFIIYLRKGQRRAYHFLFLGTFISLNLALIMIVPKVEAYSQGAAIAFYQQKQQEDCYMTTLGFKSYAQLFYFQKPMPQNPKSYSEDWLLNGDIDKPAYFVCKVNQKKKIEKQNPNLTLIGEKNGFVFFKRSL